MLLFLKKWCPVVMVILTAIGMVLHYGDVNMFSAYTTGFTGWLVVATNEFIPERSKNEG
jgi:hypothetical protein